jgi:hypothetical protein
MHWISLYKLVGLQACVKRPFALMYIKLRKQNSWSKYTKQSGPESCCVPSDILPAVTLILRYLYSHRNHVEILREWHIDFISSHVQPLYSPYLVPYVSLFPFRVSVFLISPFLLFFNITQKGIRQTERKFPFSELGRLGSLGFPCEAFPREKGIESPVLLSHLLST